MYTGAKAAFQDAVARSLSRFAAAAALAASLAHGPLLFLEESGDQKSRIFAIWGVNNIGFSADSTSKNRAVITKEKSTARRRKIVRTPEIAMRRFPYTNIGKRV